MQSVSHTLTKIKVKGMHERLLDNILPVLSPLYG